MSFLIFLLTFVPGLAFQSRPLDERCCEDNQCFNNNPPLSHLPVPGCPEDFNIQYSLYTRNNQDTPETISKTEIGPSFSGSRRTIFLAHGWGADGDGWSVSMKDALLDQGDYNVVIIDWRQGAGDIWYPQAAANTRSTGANNALVMKNLVDNGGASFGNMYCIGHSLGGHVCGHTGKRTQSKMGRITGMDPAGPGFDDGVVALGRLDSGDANFVDVMHTASEGFSTIALGTDEVIGHVDFYPNNGRCQPGCDDCTPNDVWSARIAACSHGRPIPYMLESIQNSCRFTSYPCASKDDATNGNCNTCQNGCQEMGFFADQNSARGTFYLTVNDAPPYCKG